MGPVAAPRRPPCCSCFAAPSSWWCSWSLFHTVTKGSVLISPFTKLLEPQECKAFNWKFSFCHTTSPYLFHRHRHDDPAWWKIEVKACPSSSRWHMITQKWQKKNTAKKRKKKSMDTRTSRIQFLDLNHLWICTDNGQIWQLRWAALEREMKSLFASISLFSGEWFSDRLIEQGNGERRRKPTYPPSCTLQTSSIHPLPKPENQQTPQLVLFFQSFIHFPTWTFQLIEIWRFRRGNVQRITKTKKRAGPHQPGGVWGEQCSNVTGNLYETYVSCKFWRKMPASAIPRAPAAHTVVVALSVHATPATRPREKHMATKNLCLEKGVVPWIMGCSVLTFLLAIHLFTYSDSQRRCQDQTISSVFLTN